MRYWLAGCALLIAATSAGTLSAEAPPPGTISVESKVADPKLAPATPAFVTAIDDALAAKGFTVLEGEGHAGLVAYFHLTRIDVGSGKAKVLAGKASAGPGGSEGVGASILLPLPSGKAKDVPLRQTKLELAIARRGGDTILWQAAAVTVRPAGTREGKDETVAADLAEVLLRTYPAQPDDVVSIP